MMHEWRKAQSELLVIWIVSAVLAFIAGTEFCMTAWNDGKMDDSDYTHALAMHEWRKGKPK